MRGADAAVLERCLVEGGVAVVPTDTVYGLACDPGSEAAVRRMHALKGRAQGRPAAVMFCSLEAAEAALEHIGGRTRGAVARLLPGPLTVLLPAPAGGDEALGLRVPRLEGALAPLTAVRRGMLQTSANPTGGRDPRRVTDIPLLMRQAADLVLDAGELPGVPSSVVDLRGFEDGGDWRLVREGAVSHDRLERALSSLER